jgi:RluA family pseudouridine synthase
MAGPIKLSSPETHQFWEIAVLYSDAQLLALEKPAGLPVSPDPEDPGRPSLMPLLHDGIAAGKPWAREHGLTFLNNVQRLDTEISGVLLLARDKPTQLKLADWFGAARPGRRYIALVDGQPQQDGFEIDARLEPHPARPGLVHVDAKHGKAARTQFEIVERFLGFSLLKCEAFVDRRHQVRVHLQHARFPVVGDRAYGGKLLLLSRLKPGYRPRLNQPERPLLSAPALHADQLDLPHPLTGQPLTIRSNWPKPLNVALKYLRRYSQPSGQAPVEPSGEDLG